jgi:murein L,D-transpeptidase YafK
VVLSSARELWLCAQDGSWTRFTVALGRRGVGKRRTGDERTPLGTYAVGEPRPSARYGTFIPIVYPTVRQAALGFSGTEVGIHGPPRGMDSEKYPTTEVNWTQGCIATGTDEEVEVIAAFVRERRPRLVIR